MVKKCICKDSEGETICAECDGIIYTSKIDLADEVATLTEALDTAHSVYDKLFEDYQKVNVDIEKESTLGMVLDGIIADQSEEISRLYIALRKLYKPSKIAVNQIICMGEEDICQPCENREDLAIALDLIETEYPKLKDKQESK